MPLSPGHQAEIIRSNQKDEYYLSYLRASLSDVIHTWLGPRLWMSWQREVDVAADLLYFGLTTLGGYQTLGEEYVSLIQTDPTRRQVPTLLRRMLMVGLQVFSPYILQSLLTRAERHLRLNQSLPLSARTRGRILNVLPTLRYTITLLQRCHLVAFYINGAFYHVSKRISGIHYVRVSSGGGSGSTLVYKILGTLSILQLVLAALHHIYTQYTTTDKLATMTATQPPPRVEEEEGGRPVVKCSLCLETRVKTTATPCGHLYCWACIHEWCASKSQCPICRQACTPSRLIYLRNYDRS